MLRISGVFLLAAVAMSAPADRTAFTDPRVRPPIPDRLRDRGVKRIRAAIVRNSLFDPKAAARFKTGDPPVTMNFFSGASVKVKWQQVDIVNGTVTWNGSVEGAPLGNATLLFNAGSVTANVTRGDGLMYQIRTARDGVVWLLEVDQKAFPKEQL